MADCKVLKDYKLSEIKSICEEHKDNHCIGCPFDSSFCDEYGLWCAIAYREGCWANYAPYQWEFEDEKS